jgi:alkylhydroperoxidase family enzyme
LQNPAVIIPDAMQAIQAFNAATRLGGVPETTRSTWCAVCVDAAANARKAGETDERLFTLVAWRDTPYFNDAERAALALTDAVTRLSDRMDPVPDAVWEEATRHYDEWALAALVLWIATVNVFNRLNVATRQVSGEWPGRPQKGGSAQ